MMKLPLCLCVIFEQNGTTDGPFLTASATTHDPPRACYFYLWFESGPQPENDGQTPRFCSNSPRDTNRAPSPWRSLRLHFTYKDAPSTTTPSLHHLVKYHERPRQRFGGVCPARLKKIAGRNPYRRHSALVVTALVIRATNAQSEGRLGRNN
jgi:hypothetical protein